MTTTPKTATSKSPTSVSQRSTASTGRRYRDLHEHLDELERRGLLVRVQRPIIKETELHPLVRWQYRGGIPESQRKAWLFENVVDVKGKRYDIPVVVGALAATPEIYALGLGCAVEEIGAVWEQVLAHPLLPQPVASGRAQELVWLGEELAREGNGFDAFPVPISTPGFDNAPYTTCSHWITKDPETGIQNIGNYRGHIKSRTRIGCFPSGLGQDIQIHWEKAKALGRPLEAALVVGAPPAVSYAAVQKVPYGVDEMAVAGALATAPIPVVACKTVDLVVPADAEIVFEGVLSTEYLEPEGPFGESHGYMHPRQFNPYMELTAITRRRDAVWTSFISQVTPSESSVIKKVGYEPMFLNHLRSTLHIPSVVKVGMHEALTNLRKVIVIQFRRPQGSDIWRALMAATVFHKGVGKIVVAVDEDIDPQNGDAILWAMSYRMKPHRDVQIVRGMEKGHAPPFSGASDSEDVASWHDPDDESAMLIDATLKQPFPPISLPTRPYMEQARAIWEELGLPQLAPQAPWYGYSLGQWDAELEEEAELAARGEHYQTGEKLSRHRRPV
jgi:4-hydroxy-3-polyprenylbenzoate decarboxylase